MMRCPGHLCDDKCRHESYRWHDEDGELHSTAIATIGHNHWLMAVVARYGYLALFGIICAQDVGVPTFVPGSLILLFAGYLASIGALNLIGAGLAAAAGAMVGASVLFALARLGGDTFLRHSTRLLRMDSQQHARVERFLWRWGLPAWVLFRFLPGVRIAATLVAGLGGIPTRDFALLTALASLIWAYTLVLIGLWLGPHWERAGRILIASGPITLVVVVVLGIVIYVRRPKQR